MLDFLLVLGLVPFTNIQITFYEYIGFWSAVFVIVFRQQLKEYAIYQWRELAAYLKAKYWQRKQLSLPLQVESIGRKG